MHRRLRKRSILRLAAILATTAAPVACSSSSSGSSSGAGTNGAPVVNESPAPGCNDVVNVGADITASEAARSSAPGPSGGSISDGVYVLTSAVHYVDGSAGPSGGVPEHETIVVSGNEWYRVDQVGANTPSRENSRVDIAGGMLTKRHYVSLRRQRERLHRIVRRVAERLSADRRGWPAGRSDPVGSTDLHAEVKRRPEIVLTFLRPTRSGGPAWGGAPRNSLPWGGAARAAPATKGKTCPAFLDTS
jgi:hypothetical protein